MTQEYFIPARTGIKIEAKRGQRVTVIDAEGGQVADFFAEITDQPDEFLSTGVTIDRNASLKLKVGDLVYSNLYRPIFKVLYDDVCAHDHLHPCCRPEMYDFFYRNGANHPNCLDNINRALGKRRAAVTPVNLFINTQIDADGTVTIEKPKSKAGDKIILEALEDVTVAVAACSVSESKCNGGKCSAIKLIVG